ncbi:MAG: hypothetical protein JO146_08270 [Candidatus Eremiobacteraeota bacterium]|nr:hypothetical protein [Candidatus Eremiobacteraeota bacterium]
MERIDAAQARDHIEMVDRILAESHPRLCAGGDFFVVWGVASAYITVLFHLVDIGMFAARALWSVPIVLAAAALYSVLRARSLNRRIARTSLVQREFFNVLWLTLGVTFVANVAAFRIFTGIAQAALWSIAEAIVLLYIAMHGNRRAQIAGVLVVVSLVAANFVAPDRTAYVLAAGMLAGYAGFGISELLAAE